MASEKSVSTILATGKSKNSRRFLLGTGPVYFILICPGHLFFGLAKCELPVV